MKTLRPLRVLAAVAAFALICALGAAGPAASSDDERASASRASPCGYGFKKTPPRKYRFRISGHTTSETYWGDGKETYLYTGVMKRMVCRGTIVEYWQTRGRVSQTFTNIQMGHPDCEFTGQPPHYGIGNSPTRSRPLRRFEVDVGFEWHGNGRKYQTSVINPRNGELFAHGTVKCPPPPAANGSTVPYTFEHVSTDLFTIKGGPPRRVIKGRIVNYLDPLNLHRYTFRWRLRATRPLRPAPTL